MGKKLDRSKPFGEIFGGNSEARFVQDGTQFDAHGDEVGAEAAPAKKGKTAPKPADTTPVSTGADAQVQAFLGEGATQ